MARSKLADFEIVSRLGSGSFGTVYKVKRYIDNNLYVIKNVRIVELSFKEQSEAINEVQILAQLKSPYVVRYYDSFIETDSLHIVMEFCNRGDLQNLIKRAKDKNVDGLRENVIWNITLQIMLGLHYLHKKHILHRDLKSANVFLMKDETKSHYLVKIGDLGVAKLMDTSTALANTIVGTPYYLSPELCADMPYRDKSDCWALGVLMYECATLQHPFEARNQCALIMKIIEAQVKIPSSAAIKTEMRHVILWLLQKDPNARPSIKDVLNERIIRDKLEEHQFDLPEELKDAKVTDFLSSPAFDKKDNLKKKASGVQLMNIRHQEENRASSAADKEQSRDKRLSVHHPTPSVGKLREQGSNKELLRIGGDGTPASPSSGGGKGGVRRTGSTTANSNNNNSDAKNTDLNQPIAFDNLSVAGNGVGPRSTSSQQLTKGPSFKGPSSNGAAAMEQPQIRGDRVRGPAFSRRVPSEKALTRHQVRPPPSYSQTGSSRNSDSKLDTSDSDSKVDIQRTTPRDPSIPNMHRDEDEYADAKEASEYEEDFEDDDEEDAGKSGTNPIENNDRNATENTNGRLDYVADGRSMKNLSASRKFTADEVSEAQEKDDRNGSTLTRLASMKADFNSDDKSDVAPLRGSLDPRRQQQHLHFGSSLADPFHQTDGSSVVDPSHYTGTMTGENDMWDPVWTERRGLIENSGKLGTESEFYNPLSHLHSTDVVQEEEDEDEGNEYFDGADEDDYGDESGDVDIPHIMDMIDDLKSGAIAMLGEPLFWKVYNLCSKYMQLPMESASPLSLVQELEATLLEGGGSLETACEVVVKVKSLLAFESSYNLHMDRKVDEGKEEGKV